MANKSYFCIIGLTACTFNRLSFRFALGTWAIVAFVLVQAYTATLFIYIMAPIRLPLINSANDIAENTNVNLLVKKGSSIEYLFKVKFLFGFTSLSGY